MKIEIYDRKNGETVERIDVDDMRSFLVYWREQCDSSEFGYRVVENGDA